MSNPTLYSARLYQFIDPEVASIEFPNGERHAVHAARRNDDSHAASIRQSRVKDRFSIGDVAAETASDILHRDHERSFAKVDVGHGFNESALLNEDMVRPINHNLADRIVSNEVFCGLKKREDGFEAIHQSSPS